MIEATSLVVAFGVLTCLATVLALGAILKRMGRRHENVTAGSERLKDERTPLENLKSSDLQFLREHPTISRTVARELRRERRKVLREYLRLLRGDFERTCADIRLAIVQSAVDRPDLTRII